MCRTSVPSESTTMNETLAGSDRSKPISLSSRYPSPFGEKCAGFVAKRITSGKSPFSCWVRKKAPIVATTRTAKTARTRGRVIGSETLGECPACECT